MPRHDISAEQLMKTNGLPDDKLFAGQKLTIIQTAYTPSIYQWSERGKNCEICEIFHRGLKRQLERRRLKRVRFERIDSLCFPGKMCGRPFDSRWFLSKGWIQSLRKLVI
ncbi:LysM peptidoglycan-binding domain-containing protein [[Brevibacterium] frigoritolerans]|uniref:LysM peptidoglycan-binding domain-containing protein n=1 Tax=Peribacillus frigoritolerans TaxID=450367 RepID=A0A941J9S4_9BACI|nr:LysM peptidoglycan-binding domain-containing protein [Peribacillus frigoritolerans]